MYKTRASLGSISIADKERLWWFVLKSVNLCLRRVLL
jgi:hypothetical protein